MTKKENNWKLKCAVCKSTKNRNKFDLIKCPEFAQGFNPTCKQCFKDKEEYKRRKLRHELGLIKDGETKE